MHTAKIADNHRRTTNKFDEAAAPDLTDFTLFLNGKLSKYEEVLAHKLAWNLLFIRRESTDWHDENPLYRHLVRRAHEVANPNETVPFYLRDEHEPVYWKHPQREYLTQPEK
jgi:hypothetical protein